MLARGTQDCYSRSVEDKLDAIFAKKEVKTFLAGGLHEK